MVTKLDTNSLNIIYSNVGKIDEINDIKCKYFLKLISVFPCKLSNEEASDMVLFYDQSLKEKNKQKVKQYNDLYDNLMAFYLELYKYFQIFPMFVRKKNNQIVISKFDNINEYKLHITLSIKEKKFLRLIIPECYSVIKGSFDLTHLLYTLKSKKECNQKIIDIIKSQGLYILEPY